MDINKIDASGNSCNFCDRGKLDPRCDARLVFPYDKVLSIARSNKSGVKVNMCKQCVNELVIASKVLENNDD